MERHTVQGFLEHHLADALELVGFPLYQIKALRKVSQCRTSRLGGHAQYCEDGHLSGIWYNSCKNRFCPQCRGMATEEWLLNTQRTLLDCPHHHVIFTLPHELHGLWRYNREEMTSILLRSVKLTIDTFAKDPKYLKAMPGIISALHTWGRDLCLHPHVHTLISHGGVNTEGQWITPKKKSLFPQKPVMQVFRGKMLAGIKDALQESELTLPDDRSEHQIRSLLNKLGRRDWVVHFCPRYDHPKGVAKYLARYVKQGPLKSSQLKSVTPNTVTFSYRSHVTEKVEKMTLPTEVFIERIAQHIPLPGKPPTRYAGRYSSAARKRLNIARLALGQAEMSGRIRLDYETFFALKDYEKPVCQVCGKPLLKYGQAVQTLAA